MEALIKSKHLERGISYQLLGNEKQTLQVILLPGQKICTKMQALLYTSDNMTKTNKKLSCLKRLCARRPGIQNQHIDIELNNDTSAIAYAGLQLMKGKIIVIDNTLEETRNMVIKNNYIIAHTCNVEIGKFSSNEFNNHLDYSH